MNKDNWLVKNLPTVLCVVGLAAIAVAGAALILYAIFVDGSISTRSQDWAIFGDYVGGVLNPIYGLLALLALLMTLYVQLKELRQSTHELQRSAEALASQNRSMAIQNFENAFFQMVRLHHEIVNTIDLHRRTFDGRSVLTQKGRDCFRTFYSRLKSELERANRGDFAGHSRRSAIAICYFDFHHRNQQNLGHYFRNLYRAFKLIDDSDEISDKHKYSGILRAQLSSYELALLFYNGLSDVGTKFPKLIEKFQLFENMDIRALDDWSSDRNLYSSSAFGDQAVTLGLRS